MGVVLDPTPSENPVIRAREMIFATRWAPLISGVLSLMFMVNIDVVKHVNFITKLWNRKTLTKHDLRLFGKE